MHEPFQRGEPKVPFHCLHDTSSYLPSIARRLPGKNACEAPVRSHRSKLQSGLFSAHYGPNGKGKNALHLHAIFVAWFGNRLATPMCVRSRRVSWVVIEAQIVNLYYNGIPERALVFRLVWVLGWGYFEAAPASITETRVGTKRQLVDRRHESGQDLYAAGYEMISRLMWALLNHKNRSRAYRALNNHELT